MPAAASPVHDIFNAAAGRAAASQQVAPPWPGHRYFDEVKKDMNRKIFPVATAVLLSLLMVAFPVRAQTSLEIPSGTTIKVRIIDKLSSEQTQMGETFHGTLDEPIAVNGRELY